MNEVTLPHKLRNRGRKVYYKMFCAAAKETGLNLDEVNYKKTVLTSDGKVVAIIESDATVGEPDDLTNECTPGGMNNRKYDGLEIRMLDRDYEGHLKDLVLILKAILKEEIIFVFIDRSQDVARLLKEIQPNYR